MATTVTRSIEVPGNADEVFAYVADFSNTEEWDPGIVAARQTSPDPVQEGSTFELVARFMGRDLETTYRMTEYEPPHRVVLVGGTDNFESTDVITVTPADSGVTIDYKAVFELKGLLRFVEPLFRGSFNSLADKAVAGLKQTLSS